MLPAARGYARRPQTSTLALSRYGFLDARFIITAAFA